MKSKMTIQLGIKALMASLSAALSACSAIPEKNIYTSIDIDAPREVVWSILSDNTNYPEWNPYHIRVEGILQIGEKLDVEIHKPNGKIVNIHPYVMRLEPLQEITWGGGIKGIFYGEHVFLLSVLGDNRTRLVHKERFSGIAIPYTSLETIEEGYELMNLALKEKAEGQN